MLHQLFTNLALKYTTDSTKTEDFWNELADAYKAPDRYFHNLEHIEDLYNLLVPVQEEINKWDTLLFAVFYHDVVYVPLDYVVNSRDEENSALVAVDRLEAMGYPAEETARCKALILATKNHSLSVDSDTNYFTDADLAVLGRPWKAYSTYQKQIRQEFFIYPNNIFKAGRSKVLRHFLDMPRIYKTDHFYNLFEEQARENIEQELELLVLV